MCLHIYKYIFNNCAFVSYPLVLEKREIVSNREEKSRENRHGRGGLD